MWLWEGRRVGNCEVRAMCENLGKRMSEGEKNKEKIKHENDITIGIKGITGSNRCGERESARRGLK